MTVDTQPVEKTLTATGTMAPVPKGKRVVGRPRRLTLDAIVDAACKVGGETPDRAEDYAANILSMLERRGLTRGRAIDIHIEANQAIIGAAIMLIRCKDIADTKRDAEGRPMSLPKGLGDYRPTLDRIIRDFEEGRAAVS
ncbi:hypothetical protein [Novosphingobium sp. MMS21-SN21R]|uniref:hypothetical protein n=1 Tax=Novosphingobium sp. MMS21-SN21R TaxID=2969298 RepID=UPI0028848194|nr:hypothetical protein [Novosphingobium sp. MMS21-SN21R]MDT0509925.1 hypothetical protein [Novosphingobium sp. MMS21-SN21R]